MDSTLKPSPYLCCQRMPLTDRLQRLRQPYLLMMYNDGVELDELAEIFHLTIPTAYQLIQAERQRVATLN